MPTYYNGDVLTNLLKFLKYRTIIIDGTPLTVIEIFPGTMEFLVVRDGRFEKYFLDSTSNKIQLTNEASAFIVNYIQQQMR